MGLQRKRLLLASQSSARAQVLRQSGVRFEARPAWIDEGAVKAAMRAAGASVQDVALALAAAKAGRVAEADAIVIGADQILLCDGRWFDKPADMDEARAHLQALRGRTHTLVTAVCCVQDGAEAWRHVEQPRLTMRAFSDGFLEEYLAHEGEAVLASVGAYRLEGRGVQLFEQVEGAQSSILGLPLLALLAWLRAQGVLTA